MTLSTGLQSTKAPIWSMINVFPSFHSGQIPYTLDNGFFHFETPMFSLSSSHSFADQQNTSLWLSRPLNFRIISATTSSMFAVLLIPQNATLKFLKHLSMNSVSHGLNTIRRVMDRIVVRIDVLGFGQTVDCNPKACHGH